MFKNKTQQLKSWWWINVIYNVEFSIYAPNLKYFRYCGFMNIDVIQVNAFEMEEVDHDFSHEYGFEGHGLFIYNMLVHLFNVRVLTVCSWFL